MTDFSAFNEVYYRLENASYSTILDADREVFGTEQHIQMREFKVLRHTPAGVWIWAHGQRKFVLTGGRKAWARPTKAEALADYRARKKSYIQHCEARLAGAKAQLAAADEYERRGGKNGRVVGLALPWPVEWFKSVQNPRLENS